MVKDRENTCPGCSRHCAQGHARCKYGRRYFEKRQQAQKEHAGNAKKADKRKTYKWEKHVLPNGLAWKLLWTGSRCRRALRRKEMTEQELLCALSEQEQAQLAALLDKIQTKEGSWQHGSDPYE